MTGFTRCGYGQGTRQTRQPGSRSSPQCRCAAARMKQPRPLTLAAGRRGADRVPPPSRAIVAAQAYAYTLCLRPPPPLGLSQPWSHMPVGWLAGRAFDREKSLQRSRRLCWCCISKGSRLQCVVFTSAPFLRPEQQRPAMTALAVFLWRLILKANRCHVRIPA